MISAGRTYGILSRGMRARLARDQRLNDDQIDKAAKKMQERDEKWLEEEVAKVKKIGLGFPKCVLPIERMVRYRGRMVSSKWTPGGDLCRKGKDKIGKIVPETDNRALKASTDQFTKITKEQFLDLLQARWLVHSKSFRFSNKDDIALWKKGKKAAKNSKAAKAGKAAKAKVIKEYKKFRKLYLKDLREQFIKKLFVMVDGEIYMKPPKDKTIKAVKGIPYNPNNQCYDTRLDRLDIYKDCDCAFEDGDVKCEYLHEDKFPKRLGDAPEGEIRLKIYYNRTTQKIRLIPDRDNFAAPTGYLPVNMRALKRLLSRHKDKGGKLLLEYLKLTETRKLAKETSPIFRTKDERFAVNMPVAKYLVYFNQHLGKVERREVVKRGIRLTQQEAEALIKTINATPELRLNRHQLPIRVDNFLMRNKLEKTNGDITYEYHFDADFMFLEKLETFIKSKYVEQETIVTEKVHVPWYAPWRPGYKMTTRGTGKYSSTIDNVKASTLKTLINRIGDWLIRRKSIKDSAARQKLGLKEGRIARKESIELTNRNMVVHILVSVGVSILSLFGMAMLWMESFRNKVVSFVREKTYPIKSPLYKARRALLWNKSTLAVRKFPLLKWIPILGVTDRKEAKFRAKGNRFEQEGIQLKETAEKRLKLDQHPEWKQRILKISEGEQEITQKISEGLLKHPDRLIIGFELKKEAWKYIGALNEQDMGHPTPFGPSGAGKMILAKAAAQLVVMDDLWHNKQGELVKAVETLYKGDPDSTRAQALLAQYEKASLLMRERYENVTGMQFFRLDKSRMQGTTDAMVGAMQKHLMHMDDAMAHRVVIIIPELPDILQAGEYGGGRDRKVNKSEQFGMNFKEKAERPGAHYSPDTLPKRLLDVLQDPDFNDLFRRIMDHDIYLAHRSPKEILKIVKGRFIQGPLEDAHNVHWGDKATEYATRLTLNFGWKKGQPPLGEVIKQMKAISTHVKHREMDKRKAALASNEAPNWYGKSPIKIKETDVVEYFRQVHKMRIADPETVGRDIYEKSGEDLTLEKELRAIRALDTKGNNEIRFPVEENLLRAQRRRIDSPQVRKIALEIDAARLGGKSDDPKTAALAMKIARRLDALAGRTFANTEAIEAFLYGTGDREGMLEKVLPIELDKLDHVRTSLQQDIIRAMDPSRYGNNLKAKESILTPMEKVAIELEKEVIKAEKMLLEGAGRSAIDQTRLNEVLQAEIDRVVEAHEKKYGRNSDTIPRPPAPKPPPNKNDGGTPPASGGAAGTGEGVARDRKSAPKAPSLRRQAHHPKPESTIITQQKYEQQLARALAEGWRIDPTAAAVMALQRGTVARGPQAVSYHHMSPDAVGRMVHGQIKGHNRSSHLMVGGRLNPYALAGLRQSVKQTVFQRFMIRTGLGTRSAARSRKAEVHRRRGPARRAMTMIPTKR